MFKLNKKISLIVAGIVIVVLLLTGATIFLLKEKNKKEEIASSQKIKEKTVNYINQNILAGKATASITNISKDHDLYKIKLKIQDSEYDSYISKDGALLFPQVVDLNATPQASASTTPQTNASTTIGNFVVAENEICKENGKPIVYFFGSKTCSHCTWEKPIVEKVLNNFKDNVSFHENIDSENDREIFSKYSQGGIPTLVLGCKYSREGSGENAGEENETKNLTALICQLTDNQPSKICDAVKNLIK